MNVVTGSTRRTSKEEEPNIEDNAVLASDADETEKAYTYTMKSLVFHNLFFRYSIRLTMVDS